MFTPVFGSPDLGAQTTPALARKHRVMIAPTGTPALNYSAAPAAVASPLPLDLGNRLTCRRWRVLVLLTLVVALSAADLYLTVMYTSTIGMPELNPLARALLRHGSVLDLVLWKLGSVTLCTGILFRLRDRRSAELGAWVAFVALALLTMQWMAYARIHEDIAVMNPGIDYRMAAAYEPNWVELGSPNLSD